MRVPLEWLREYCDPDLEVAQLASALTIAGTKVDRIIRTENGPVLEFEITPNRPDCLGVYGLAREMHALTGEPLGAPPWRLDRGSSGPLEGLAVSNEVPELCARFTARVFDNVIVRPSPDWLARRLLAAGERPINNVVDITNYVMLLTGHPLHAFDLDRIEGQELTVREAIEGERLVTLDDTEHVLDEGMIVIADAHGPTSLAGVMGGARSQVGETTSRVVIEAASWTASSIHETSRRLDLRSEASARFAKTLAPEQVLEAQVAATTLMLSLTHATARPGTLDVAPPDVGNTSRALLLRAGRASSLLGQEIPLARQQQTFQALGFTTEGHPEGLLVGVPPFRRADVSREADLVEEIARFALDELPTTLPKHRPAARLSPQQRLARRVVDALIGFGINEIAGWAFTRPEVADRLRLAKDDPRRRFVKLENPLSEEHAIMRTTLLSSTLDAAAHNSAHGRRDMRLFEIGRVFRARSHGLPHEHRSLLVLLVGDDRAGWHAEPRTVDALAAKAVLEALGNALRTELVLRTAGQPDPFLHPSRAGTISAAGETLGWLGDLHPQVTKNWGLTEAAGFELDFDRLLQIAAVRSASFESFTRQPAVLQDLAIVIDDATPAGHALAIVARHASAVELFDVYAGEPLAPGQRSLTVHCQFTAPGRTRTDAEIAAVRVTLAEELASIGATLRT